MVSFGFMSSSTINSNFVFLFEHEHYFTEHCRLLLYRDLLHVHTMLFVWFLHSHLTSLFFWVLLLLRSRKKGRWLTLFSLHFFVFVLLVGSLAGRFALAVNLFLFLLIQVKINKWLGDFLRFFFLFLFTLIDFCFLDLISSSHEYFFS